MDDLYLDADHHDHLYPSPVDEFWHRMVEEHGDPVLELGCGTGRIALNLASKGHEVTGIDYAPAMLDRAISKATDRDLRAEFIQAAARSFSLNRCFRTIIFPTNALCHIMTPSGLRRSRPLCACLSGS